MITNENVRSGLSRLIGPYIHFVPMDEVVASAFRLAGGTAEEIDHVDDSELSPMEGTQIDAFLDTAIVRALEAIVMNLDQREMERLGIRETVEQATARFERRILAKTRYLKETYGIGLGAPELGQMDLGIAQGADNSSEEW